MFGKKKTISDINYLELTPTHIHPHVVGEDGKASVLVPRFKNKVLFEISSLFRSTTVKAKLDKFGSQTWLVIDGKKNVQEIIDNLRKNFGEEIEPAEERVTTFLTELYKFKFISFNELTTRRS
ncbi:MAG: PqqD family protein [Ignavibacteriaceae bacterium]|nr:PqqD family protein [Ignavibacteriaceae bacterium]